MAGNTPKTDYGQGGRGPSEEERKAAQQQRQQTEQAQRDQGEFNPSDPRQPEKGEQYPFAKQTQTNPGDEFRMDPLPDYGQDDYQGHGKLKDKVAIVTGGDSGIGRAVALMFAREGAHVAISYLNEDKDAEDTKAIVEGEGRRAILIRGDLESEEHCNEIVQKTVDAFGRIDVLVNNAAFQGTDVQDITELSRERVERTFKVNIIAMFSIVKAAVEHMAPGSTIVNLASVAGFKGSPQLLDYASTKGAIRFFTKGLAQMLAPKRGIRVNAVAPGPIWTPIQPSSFSADKVAELGKSSPLLRAGQPKEVGTCVVFLATSDSSYVNGEVLTVTGGDPSAS